MTEQMAFARKASGLVRGLSIVDAFGVGFMNQGITVSMWVMISMGLSVYTGGNLIIATLLSAFFCGVGFPLVWGILGGSMPRVGRRIHLQLPHPASPDRHCRIVRECLCLDHVDLRPGSLDGGSRTGDVVPIPGEADLGRVLHDQTVPCS